jgi:hypothetical protein
VEEVTVGVLEKCDQSLILFNRVFTNPDLRTPGQKAVS